jgi:hypothetical protein
VAHASFSTTPGGLTFDATTWSQPQVLTIRAAEDPYGVDGTVRLVLSAPGLSPVSVALTERDNDPSGADGATRTLRFDFGSGSGGFMTTNIGWNNLTTTGVATPILDAVDTNGNNTGIGLAIDQAFEFILTDALAVDTLYPVSAQQDFFRTFTGSDGVFRFTGVPANWSTRIVIFGSGQQQYGASTGYRVQATRKTLNTYTNTGRVVVFTNVVADSNGAIIVRVDNDGLSYGRINVLELEGGPPAEPEDSDGDGLPDWWESMHGPNGTSLLPGIDADGDGMTNQEEFLAGTDPFNPASVLALDLQLTAPGHDSPLLIWAGVSGRVYRVQSAPHPHGTFTPLSPQVPWTTPHHALSTPLTNPAMLYRIIAEPTP